MISIIRQYTFNLFCLSIQSRPLPNCRRIATSTPSDSFGPSIRSDHRHLLLLEKGASTLRSLQVVLAGLRSLYWERYDMWAAGSMLTVAPVMLLYAVAQKQFIRGITMTGLKA